MTESNYEKARKNAAQLFCTTDHEALVERFHLQQRNGFLLLRFFGQMFRLNMGTGLIERQVGTANLNDAHANISAEMHEESSSPNGAKTPTALSCSSTSNTAQNTRWQEAQFNESMSIYDLLGYAQPTCHASGNMTNMKSLHMKIASTAPSSNDFYRNARIKFVQNPHALQAAIRQLGGIPLDKADIAARFPVFDDLTMELHFWMPDEDFDASLQFFWDENVLQYMHYETVWYANNFLIDEIERCLP